MDNYTITNNGKELLTGDETSIKMIYANLSGKNIYGVLYYMYLESLASEGLRSGEIALCQNGKPIEQTIIKFNDKKRQ